MDAGAEAIHRYKVVSSLVGIAEVRVSDTIY